MKYSFAGYAKVVSFVLDAWVRFLHAPRVASASTATAAAAAAPVFCEIGRGGATKKG